MPPKSKRAATVTSGAHSYAHDNKAVQRPDVGLQQEFLKVRKPPKTYRYDSSLDPALSWDENPGREQAEWLLGLIERCAEDGEGVVFAEEQLSANGRIRVGSLKSCVAMLKNLSQPFLNWSGKAERADIQVPTLPLFVHERHSTKAIIDGLVNHKAKGSNLDLFGDPGLDLTDKLRAYEHVGPWTNRMILGDSLVAMNSLLEYEGLGGQVQMIYIDPPYGIKFGSNWQVSTRRRDLRDGRYHEDRDHQRGGGAYEKGDAYFDRGDDRQRDEHADVLEHAGRVRCLHGLPSPLDEIDDREQHDPHRVDEVPVQANRFDADTVARA